MLALSIRQPYVELILRGVKRIEYRSRPTRIVGERFYLYASKGRALTLPKTLTLPSAGGRRYSSDNLSLPENPPPPWMIELANALRLFPGELPTGVIVGSAVIEKVTPGEGSTAGYFHWHLADVQRLKTPRKPKGHPQPVWFTPF